MKKIAFILVFILLFSMTVFAKEKAYDIRTEKIDKVMVLDKNQVKMLQAYGLSDTEIKSLTVTDLREILNGNTPFDVEAYIGKDTYKLKVNENKDELIKKIIINNGLALGDYDILKKENYPVEELLELNKKDMDSLVESGKVEAFLAESKTNANISDKLDGVYSPTSISSTCEAGYVNCPAPDGYRCVSSVPFGGGYHESIIEAAFTKYGSIYDMAINAEVAAATLFNSTTSNVLASYYLWGEWGEDPGRTNWSHEGLDMQTYGSYDIYNPISRGSKVVYSDSTTVSIYDTVLDVTFAYQHLSNSFETDDWVGPKGKIGTKYSGENHVHAGVFAGNTGNVAPWTGTMSGRDLTLVSAEPYSYINWYAGSGTQ